MLKRRGKLRTCRTIKLSCLTRDDFPLFLAGFYQFPVMNFHWIFKLCKNIAKFYRMWVFGVIILHDFISTLKIIQQTTEITKFYKILWVKFTGFLLKKIMKSQNSSLVRQLLIYLLQLSRWQVGGGVCRSSFGARLHPSLFSVTDMASIRPRIAKGQC